MMAEPASLDQPHWSQWLRSWFQEDREVPLGLQVHGGADSHDAVAFASRLRGVFEAMRLRSTTGQNGTEIDPLAQENPADVLDLLEAVHFDRLMLQAFEERVLELLHYHYGVSLRTLAQVLEVSSPETVRQRLLRIDRAKKHHRSAAALDEDPMSAGHPITDEPDEPDQS
jgi:hypothetical protein